MKNNYMLIILTSILLGLLIGMSSKEYSGTESTYIIKDKATKKEIKQTNKNIKKLYSEKDKLEVEMNKLKLKYEDNSYIKDIDKIKKDLSYTDIEGDGIIIKIDALNDEVGNIASFIDYNKVLINIINDLKKYGSEFISINNQRINQYSEIVLAGSHININSVPVVQPYEIKAIGNINVLSKYDIVESKYIEDNQFIKFEKNIQNNIYMNKINIPNKLKYIGGE